MATSVSNSNASASASSSDGDNLSSHLNITEKYDIIRISNYNEYHSHIMGNKLCLIHNNNDNYNTINIPTFGILDITVTYNIININNYNEYTPLPTNNNNLLLNHDDNVNDNDDIDDSDDDSDDDVDDSDDDSDDNSDDDVVDGIRNITRSQIRNYNLNKSRILNCIVKRRSNNSTITNKQKYRTILLDIWSRLPTQRIIQNTKLNILLTNQMGINGYWWSPKINMSVQYRNLNVIMNEIIRFSILYNYKIDIVIKLVNGEIIRLKL